MFCARVQLLHCVALVAATQQQLEAFAEVHTAPARHRCVAPAKQGVAASWGGPEQARRVAGGSSFCSGVHIQ